MDMVSGVQYLQLLHMSPWSQ
uniref:Uncharacterized protein n=1 Tax=Arundo donax TaxID=35708 RepID=A0A0A9CD45_ARUDO